jgi:hypothetical protein
MHWLGLFPCASGLDLALMAGFKSEARQSRSPTTLMIPGVRSMRLLPLFVIAVTLMADQTLAQAPAQKELNELTGAPEGTRCFKAIRLAQSLATRYVASGICPQLRPMDPGQFFGALNAQGAIDQDFTGDSCQLQFALMFRAGREWIVTDPKKNCVVVLSKLQKLDDTDAFRGLIR